MKIQWIAGVSLAVVLSVHSTFADEPSSVDSAIAESIATVEATSDDQEAARLVKGQTEAVDAAADQAVKDGTLTPEQARVVKVTNDNAREASKVRGFRKALLKGLKKAGKAGLYVAKGVGYGAEAATLGLIATPALSTIGFTAGVISGEKLPKNQLASGAVVLTSAVAGLEVESVALNAVNATGVAAIAIPLGVVAANNLIVCGVAPSRTSDYCKDISTLNVALTEGALSQSHKAGAKTRNFFKKLPKRVWKGIKSVSVRFVLVEGSRPD